MNFSEKLKSRRKEFKMSQEQLAEKLGVSRQAVAKWETDGGLPDIENLLSVASLFNTTVDDLLSSEKQLKNRSDFFYSSTVEYDADSKKHFDINLGSAYEITLCSSGSEKLHIQLASNTISEIGSLLKVRIDEGRNNIDVDIRRSDDLSEAHAKEALYAVLSVPSGYTAGVELSARTNCLKILGIETETISFAGRTDYVLISDVQGDVELDCGSDMTVVCTNLSGGIAINQLSASSALHLPKNTEYQVKKKGASNRISYTLDGAEAEAPSYPDAENTIKIAGMNTELVINECTDITEVLR